MLHHKISIGSFLTTVNLAPCLVKINFFMTFNVHFNYHIGDHL